jgi:hypothetical protein
MGARPVKAVSTADGGMDILAFDWETGELKRDIGLLEEIVFPKPETDIVSEEEFNRRVEALRAELRK